MTIPPSYPSHVDRSTLPTPAEIRDMAARGICSFPSPLPLPRKPAQRVRKQAPRTHKNGKRAKLSQNPPKQAPTMPQDERSQPGEGGDSGQVGLRAETIP
jgi:hypothetical protein